MTAVLSSTVRIRPDLLTRILSSWQSYSHEGVGRLNLTSYWADHLSHISIRRTRDDSVVVSGQSGFYFPGHSYSGVDVPNALLAFIRSRSGILQRLAIKSVPKFTQTNGSCVLLPSTLNYDWLRMLDHVSEIKKEVTAGYRFNNIAEIGSGTGILALAFKRIYPEVTYTCIDLPGTLHLACCFLASTMPDARFVFPSEFREGNSCNADFVFVDNMSIDRISPTSQQLFINTDSMQEMSPFAIRDYFALMRRTLSGPRLFYQSNREAKRMDTDIIRPTEFPWRDSDRHIFFKANEFMRYNFARAQKWGIPIILPRRRKHQRSLTVLA